MNNDKKNIDLLFREHLNGYREKTPIYAWNNLDQQLQKTKAGKTIVFYRWIAASVLILLAFGGGFWLATYQYENIDLVNDEQSPSIDNYNQTIPNSVNNNSFSKEVENEKEQVQASNSLDIEKSVEKERINEPEIAIAESKVTVFAESANNQIIEIGKLEKMELNYSIAMQILPVHQYLSPKIKHSYVDLSYQYETDLYQEIDLNNNYDDVFAKAPDVNTKTSKWIIGAQIAPITSYRDISTTYSNPGTENIDYLNSVEDKLLSMAGGVDVGYDISQKWIIQSGLYYSQIGQVNNDPLTFKHENDQFILISISTSAGDIILDRKNIPAVINQIPDTKDTIDIINELNVRVVQNFDLFEIPLIFRYRLLNKKFSVNIAGGLSPAIVVNDRTYLEADNKKYNVGSPDNLNSFIINSSFAMGLEYSFSKSLSVNFEPTLKYSMSPLNKDSKFNYHPYSISWFTGIRYRF